MLGQTFSQSHQVTSSHPASLPRKPVSVERELGEQLGEERAVVATEEGALVTSVGDRLLRWGVVLAAEHPAPRAPDHLVHDERQRRVGLVDEHTHGEHEIEPLVSEGEIPGRGEDSIDRRVICMQGVERLPVDVHPHDPAVGKEGSEPSEVATDVAADLEHRRAAGGLDHRPPEPLPDVVRRGVALDVLIAELAGPEPFEPLGLGRVPSIRHAATFAQAHRSPADAPWPPSACTP